ncbi:unnamed protein product, partial [Phaeothamnion confervicola]
CSGKWVNPATGLMETRDYAWSNGGYNFDNIGASMISVFVVATLDNWQDIFYNSMNTYE